MENYFFKGKGVNLVSLRGIVIGLISRSYYRGAIGALLVYDITSQNSFDNLPVWLKDSLDATNQNIGLILVGNKSDLEGQRQVSQTVAKTFAKDNNLMFLETSAKNGKMIFL